MPDETPGETIPKEPTHRISPRETVDPPSPPNNPPTQATQPVGTQENGREIQNLKDEVRTAEKYMIWLTGAIAFLALCTIAVGLLQWNVMSGQLSEMKSSSGQTDRLIDKTRILAENAGKQADRTKDLADRMKDQADRTKTIAEQAVVQAKATNELAAAANRTAAASESANKLATDLFKLQNRPWVGVDGEVGFDNDTVPQRANYTLKNFGNSPAFNVSMLIEPQLFFPASTLNESQITESITRQCQIAEQDVSTARATVLLFPGDKTPKSWTLGDRYIKGFLVLSGCVAYKDRDGRLHHTGLCHIVGFDVAQVAKTFDTCPGRIAD